MRVKQAIVSSRRGDTVRRLVVLGLLAAAGLGALTATAAESCTPPPLKILLTNDDGWDTPGIEALHRAFSAAGHQVRRIAPAENHSGGSAGLSIRPVGVTRQASTEFAEVYAVDGSPATTVVLGATALYADGEGPDLVISGINEGANVGPATPISGTVGATIVGLQVVDPAIPGIALSTDPIGDDYASPENLALNRRIAEFAVRLVAMLQESRCGEASVLPPGLALNVNYPPRAPEDIRGVRWARQSDVKSFRLVYAPMGDGRYVPSIQPPPAASGTGEGDTELYAEGYVTVVALDGNYSVAPEGLPALDAVAP